MKQTKLKLIEDQCTGAWGYVIAGMGIANNGDYPIADTDGILVAHDLVEHGHGIANIGPVWDEVRAMGGAWHCRGRWGDFTNMASAEENVAAGLSRMFEEWVRSDRFMGRWPRRSRKHDHDDAFRSIVSIAAQDIRNEAASCYPEMRKHIPAYGQFCLVHLRAGYNLACRRWGTGFRSNNQYHAIADALKPYAGMGEDGYPELVLHWGAGDAKVQIVDEEY